MADLKNRLAEAFSNLFRRRPPGIQLQRSNSIANVPSNTKDCKSGAMYSTDKDLPDKAPLSHDTADLWAGSSPSRVRVPSSPRQVPAGGVSCRNCVLCNCTCNKSCKSCRGCHCNNYFLYRAQKKHNH